MTVMMVKHHDISDCRKQIIFCVCFVMAYNIYSKFSRSLGSYCASKTFCIV